VGHPVTGLIRTASLSYMPNPLSKQQAALSRLFKTLATTASSGAALVSILAFVRSAGWLGKHDPLHGGAGGPVPAWVGLDPAAGTADALGDTLHFAATATDSTGGVLAGIPVAWTSSNPDVATVGRDGTVIARGEGTTTIIGTVNGRAGRARVVVRQQLARVHITSDVTQLAEGERRQLQAQPRDARGQEIKGRTGAVWHSSDTSVVRVDSLGVATAVAIGRATLTVTVDSIGDTMSLEVVATPSAVAFVGGAGQLALAGAGLPQPVIVRVVSARGNPVAGTTVRLATSDATGRIDPASVTTGADGRATAKWTLGDMPGRQVLVASVDGLAATAELAAEAEPVPATVRIAPLNAAQSAPAGKPLSDLVGVRLTDTLGRPLVDVPVSWATHDGGTLEPTGVRTDTAGEVRARWTLGPRSGTQRAFAYVGSRRRIPPAEVAATGLPGTPAALAVLSGDDQRGVVAAGLEKPVLVRMLDASRNPVSGVSVRVSPGSGAVEDSLVTTDSAGVAAVRWTLGRAAGAQRLQLRVSGVSKPLTVTARARPSAAANLTLEVAEGTRASASRREVTATVTDVFGNPVSGAPVRFSPAAGSASPSNAVTDDRGHAATRWTLGAQPGPQSLKATVLKTEVRALVTAERGVDAKRSPKKGGSRG